MDLRPAMRSTLLLLVLLLPFSANASSKLYIVYMGEKQHDDPSVVTASHHDVLTSVFGSKDEALKSIVYSYRHGFSGFAAMLTETQAEFPAEFPQVLSVKPNTYHKGQTTRSWDFLGLDYYQSPRGSAGLLQKAKYGEDIIIGVIDSGIDPEDLKGEYMSPRDLSGHGTHAASTIAGNRVWNQNIMKRREYKVIWGHGLRSSDTAVIKAIDHGESFQNGTSYALASCAHASSSQRETRQSPGGEEGEIRCYYQRVFLLEPDPGDAGTIFYFCCNQQLPG
ncbi:subtilisin-like protease SBT3.9 [Triticum aestivum]|uniref:subtilisin-like protease SBT3.9 n=1 Tax=Triticum aestivum TaxID=4565 RepID=UPI001D027A83|nr:subtilisin-like protease SBT3.9 [Triticum aestivum]